MGDVSAAMAAMFGISKDLKELKMKVPQSKHRKVAIAEPSSPPSEQSVKVDRSVQTAATNPAPMSHCERLVRRGKQNLLAKLSAATDKISDQQNTIEKLQRSNEALKAATPALNGEHELNHSVIASMVREFPNETEDIVEKSELETEDIMTILLSQFDEDTISQAMWLRYKSVNSDMENVLATGQAIKAAKVLSKMDRGPHSAYDLLMQFIAFDAVVPSQTVRDNYLFDTMAKKQKSYTQKEAEDIACFQRFVGNLK